VDLNRVNQRVLHFLPTLVVGVAAGFFVWYPISDGDIFWHLTAGREILRTAAIPHTDPFAFTSQSWQWIDLHWFYQVCMQGVTYAAGLWGVLVANSVLFGVAVAILFATTAGTRMVLVSAPLWIAGLYEVRYLAPHRPIVFSLLLFALFILCLEKYHRTRNLRFLFILLPLQIAWVNSQPLFVLGPALYTAWFAGEWMESGFTRPERTLPIPWMRVGLTGVMLLATTLVNPYGIHAWSLVLELFGRIDPVHANLFATNIPENVPLLWMIGTQEARYVYATAVMTVIALLGIAACPRSLRWSYLFVAAGMLFLAFRAQRNIILYFFAVLPLVSTLLPGAIRLPLKARSAFVTAIAAALFSFVAAVALVTHAVMLISIRAAGPVAPFSFPTGSAAYLQCHAMKGNLFNADRYGGYFLWKLYPEQRVFIDTRYAIRPKAFFAEYLAILDDPELFKKVRERFGITAVAIPVARYPRYLPLARALWSDPAWRFVFCDGAEALFVMNIAALTAPLRLDSPGVVDSVATAIRNRWAGSPLLGVEGLGYLSEFESQLGQHECAQRVRRLVGVSAD
jgi:hypothetical protein